MRNLNPILENRKINPKAIKEFGFVKNELKKSICNDEFEVQIKIDMNTNVDTNISINKNTSTIDKAQSLNVYSRVIDKFNNEEYVLVDVLESSGEFVGTIRKAYEDIINEFVQKCTTYTLYNEEQVKDVIDYIDEKYGDKPEFLWDDENGIIRNSQNDKWFIVFMKVLPEKIGLNGNERIEIIDIRYQKDETEKVIDRKRIFPGYHMNKRSWITILMNGSLDNQELFELIDNSYNLSIGNKSNMAGSTLAQKVYDYLLTIPKGKVVTYGQIAEHLGNKGLARAVGNILHKNPDGDKYPCYKVVNGNGRLADAFVFGGRNVQAEKLEKDGIHLKNGKVDLLKYQWIEKK